jgi:7-carboxy-7-deazaguanine synthase
MYQVKEIFYTLQGEGFHTGRPSVFCRFSGCNLWSGREQDRDNAVCKFCDTDFIGTGGENGGKYKDCQELVGTILRVWGSESTIASPFVVLTGGEPLLQVDDSLIECLHDKSCEIAVETNGTLLPPAGIDWICCSPKFGSPLKLLQGNEMKLVYPQIGLDPKSVESLDFEHFYLQPMDGPIREKNCLDAIRYCKRNPKWKLSLQTHKILGIP